MNNKTASLIRDFGMNRVFDGMDYAEMSKFDSGKFVFSVDVEGTVYFCEVDFVAKKEDYTPDYDVKKYAEKVANAEKREQEKREKALTAKAKKAKTE